MNLTDCNQHSLTIYHTKNYELFSFLDKNRTLNKPNLSRIKTSIQNNNFIDLCPIIVTSDGKIIDGQHRYEVCKEMNLPVYFVIYHNHNYDDVICSLNSAQEKWKFDDYKHFYNNEIFAKKLDDLQQISSINSYAIFKLIMLETRINKLSLAQIMEYLKYHVGYFDNIEGFCRWMKRFYSLSENDPFFYNKSHRKFVRNTTFITSMFYFYKIPFVDNDYLLQKVKDNLRFLFAGGNTKFIRKFIIEVYNYKKYQENKLIFDKDYFVLGSNNKRIMPT